MIFVFKDVDIKLQLNYITRLLNRLEEENVALKAANVALKTEDARLNKRLSNLEDDHHELMMKNVKIIKELSNTLKEKTKTVVPVNKELNNISSTFTDKHKSRGQKRLLVPAGKLIRLLCNDFIKLCWSSVVKVQIYKGIEINYRSQLFAIHI